MNKETYPSPSALTVSQDGPRNVWRLNGGCLHCEAQRPPAVAAERISAEPCRELKDWPYTDEEAELRLRAPHMSTYKITSMK